jgi:hypothetical protein
MRIEESARSRTKSSNASKYIIALIRLRSVLPFFPIFDNGYDISDVPKPLRHASGHSRGATQRAVDTDEVVGHEVQCHRMSMVFDLLGEAVRQPGEATHVHPHRQICPLHIAGADMAHVWATCDGFLFDPGADARAVAAGGFSGLAIGLDEHGIVDIPAECLTNRLQVRLMAVAGKLNAGEQPACEIGNEHLSRRAAAIPDKPGRDKLGIGVDRGPRPHVASPFRGGLRGLDVALLGIAERPNLIDLDAAASEVAERQALELRASLPGIDQQLRDGVDAHARDAGNAAKAHALNEKGDDLNALGARKLVHTHGYMNLMPVCQAQKISYGGAEKGTLPPLSRWLGIRC